MTLNFTAIDFETANEHRGSVCAVGVTMVRDGQIIGSGSWLVRPPTGDRYTNTQIHGITAEDTRIATTWKLSVPAIADWAGSFPLVAYNSAFDKSVYTESSIVAGITAPEYHWRDALRLAKEHLDLPRYRLPNVAQHLGIDLTNHHDAEADALACASITLAIAARTGLSDLGQLWPDRTWFPANPSEKLPQPNADADPRHILYGVSITFSGELETLTRNEARAAAAAVGAHVTTTTTKKTQIIVFGRYDPSTFQEGTSVSRKIQKALDFQASGQPIEFIDESDFIARLNYNPEQTNN